MTAEPQIDYEALAQGAMRAVVRTVLGRVAKSGLPGEHHFYIAFNTKAAGVNLSPRLRERYPEEMTVVLQHRFWDLTVTDDRFEVNLTFDSIPERLVVPFTSIKVFFDPSVPYGLQFEDANLMGNASDRIARASDEQDEAPDEAPRPKKTPTLVRADKKPRAPRKSVPGKVSEEPAEETPAVPGPAAQGKAGSKKEAPAPAEGSGSTDPSPLGGPKVVKLDAFRKK